MGSCLLKKSKVKYLAVAIDYFTKLVVVKPLTYITYNKWFWEFYANLGIVNRFATPTHPLLNGQVEVVNKTIKDLLKNKLDDKKRLWLDKLLGALRGLLHHKEYLYGWDLFFVGIWDKHSYPIKIGGPTHRVTHFKEGENEELLATTMDLAEEKRLNIVLRITAY